MLGRSLDELPPPTRRVLSQTVDYVHARAAAQRIDSAAVRFSRAAYTVHDKAVDEAVVECPDDAGKKSFYFSAK